MSDSEIRIGVVAVIPRNGQWLAIRRADHLIAGGCWCFPGGGIEPGETPAEALRREIIEEVNLAVVPQREIWRWRRPDGRLELSWWLAPAEDDGAEPVPNPAEVAEVRWVTPVAFRVLEPALPSNLAFLEACTLDELDLSAVPRQA